MKTPQSRMLCGVCAVKTANFGPSSAARTHGLLVPNQARYQLRYTRLFTFLPLYHGGGENQRFFCLWSFMWSKPLLCRFQQPGEIPQTQVSQGFAAFHLTPSRIPTRHSQSRRATNCATPGCSVGIIIPHVEIARKYLLKVFNKLLTVEFCGMSSKFFRPYN